MTPDTIQELRRTSYQISQAIAPGWERWRAHLEDAVAPVRAWLIREHGPQPATRCSSWRRGRATPASKRPLSPARPAA
jgi:hypothetical protein